MIVSRAWAEQNLPRGAKLSQKEIMSMEKLSKAEWGLSVEILMRRQVEKYQNVALMVTILCAEQNPPRWAKLSKKEIISVEKLSRAEWGLSVEMLMGKRVEKHLLAMPELKT
jgi:hypothetical protein